MLYGALVDWLIRLIELNKLIQSLLLQAAAHAAALLISNIRHPHYSLFTIHYHYPLFTIHCSLFTVHYPLFTIHCPLFTIPYLRPMGLSLLMLMGWLAVIVGGIVLVLRGKDNRNRTMMLLGYLLIAAVTLYSAYSLLF